jgi:hypothetical protein
MILKEKAIMSSLRFITETSIYKCNDDETSKMLCNLIRPISRNDYLIKFCDAVRKPDFSSVQKFDVEIWHDRIHPQFVMVLEDVVKYDEYLRRHATQEQLDMLPKHEWGKSKGPAQGLFRTIIQLFTPYDDIIINDIGEEKLKTIKKMDAFIEALSKLNETYCTASLGLMRMNQRLNEPLNTAELIKMSKAKSIQKKFQDGRSEKRKHTSRIPSLNALDGKAPAHSNSLPPDGDDDVVKSNEYVADFCALIGAGYSKDPRRPFPKTATSDTKKLTCYTYASTGKCEAGNTCQYSHESRDCKAFLKRELRKVLFSPNWDDTIMTEAKAEGRLEPKLRTDKGSKVKTFHKGGHKSHSKGDHKQLEGEAKVEKKPIVVLSDSDDDSSTASAKSVSSSGSSHTSGSGSDSEGSDLSK